MHLTQTFLLCAAVLLATAALAPAADNTRGAVELSDGVVVPHRSQNSDTGPANEYRMGESFFEPPGSEHLISENASPTEPALLLAVYIADASRRLISVDK